METDAQIRAKLHNYSLIMNLHENLANLGVDVSLTQDGETFVGFVDGLCVMAPDIPAVVQACYRAALGDTP